MLVFMKAGMGKAGVAAPAGAGAVVDVGPTDRRVGTVGAAEGASLRPEAAAVVLAPPVPAPWVVATVWRRRCGGGVIGGDRGRAVEEVDDSPAAATRTSSGSPSGSLSMSPVSPSSPSSSSASWSPSISPECNARLADGVSLPSKSLGSSRLSPA